MSEIILKKSKLASFTGVLSEEDLDAVRKEARDKVQEELKKDARKKALDQAIKEERSKASPEDAFYEHDIDLPGFSHSVVIDGVSYFHGVKYTLTGRQLSSIKEIECNAWRHEDSVGGINKKSYVQPRRHTLSGRHGYYSQ